MNYLEKMNSYVPKKITNIKNSLVRAALWFSLSGKDIKYTYDFDIKEFKDKQICMLTDHNARNSFMYTLKGYKWAKFNCMVGWQNFFDKSLFNLFRFVGIIPKMLYSPDSKAVIDTLRLARQGASIYIAPEGIQSTIGSTMPMNPATLKFIKKINLDVIVASTRGAYLINPRFTADCNKGPVEVIYKVLYRKEELSTLSIDEMYQRYLDYFSYNDFKWNKEKQYSYVCKKGIAKGYEKILYKCPLCGKEHMKSNGNTLYCPDCGLEVKLDDKFNLTSNKKIPFERLDQWYLLERKSIREEVNNPSFKQEYEVEYGELDINKLHNPDFKCKPVGSGKLILTQENMKYIGTINGDKVEKVYDYNLSPSAPAIIGRGFEIYSGHDYNQFFIKDTPELSVKAMIQIEELHNRIDQSWKKCSDDVYR